jgi:hypothetical protein
MWFPLAGEEKAGKEILFPPAKPATTRKSTYCPLNGRIF